MLLLCQTFGSSRLMAILQNVGILKFLGTFHQRNVKYQNHVDDASQPNTSLGGGKRHKRPNKRFLPSSDDESVGVYGPTQPETIVIPTIPGSLLRNSVDGGVPAVRPTAPLAVQRRCNNSVDDPGVSGPTQTEAIVIPTVPVSLLRNSVGGVPAALPMSPFEVQQSCSNSFEEVSQHMRGEITVNSTDDNSPVSYNNLYSQEMPYSGTIGNQRMSVAVPKQSNILSEVEMPNGSTRNVFFGNQRNQSNTLTDGSVALIGKLVRQVLKLQEFISNMMAKLVVMESKMESHRQPVAETLANPEFLLEPLQEMEEIQALEESLRDPDLYFQLVGWDDSFLGRSIHLRCLETYLGLKQSIVTKAVFDGVRTTSRKSNNFELETKTKEDNERNAREVSKTIALERQRERINSHWSAKIENYSIIQEFNLEYSEKPSNFKVLIKINKEGQFQSQSRGKHPTDVLIWTTIGGHVWMSIGEDILTSKNIKNNIRYGYPARTERTALKRPTDVRVLVGSTPSAVKI
ncbi:hypothetical protein OUZ56_025362 [Daphnia magna]|uniref:Uncharacterized protein n=1 Tax=Daphnia magna TaxID=35525 RepID=A0ABQ9ZJM7_9CRUS|nr:hypothetical protein OUZ56_025362 [Daphnia magna]